MAFFIAVLMYTDNGRAHGARGLAGVEHVRGVERRARRRRRAPRRAPARARRRYARCAHAGGKEKQIWQL